VNLGERFHFFLEIITRDRKNIESNLEDFRILKRKNQFR